MVGAHNSRAHPTWGPCYSSAWHGQDWTRTGGWTASRVRPMRVTRALDTPTHSCHSEGGVGRVRRNGVDPGLAKFPKLSLPTSQETAFGQQYPSTGKP